MERTADSGFAPQSDTVAGRYVALPGDRAAHATRQPAADAEVPETRTARIGQTAPHVRADAADRTLGTNRPPAADSGRTAIGIFRPASGNPLPAAEHTGTTNLHTVLRLRESNPILSGTNPGPSSGSIRVAATDTQPAADASLPALDSLQPTPDCVFATDSAFATGTLPSGPLAAEPVSPYRQVAPEAIFGTLSVPAAVPQPVRPEPQPLTGDPLFQIFLLLLAALYARYVYLRLDDVCLLFARASKDSVSGKQRIFDDQSNAGHARFLNTVWVVGLLFAGAAALRLGSAWIPDALPPRAALPASLTVAALLFVLSLVQFGALRVAGAITLTQPFIGQLIHLRRTYFALAFLALAPVVLLCMLVPEGRGAGWEYVLAAEAVIIGALYLKETLTLFLSKKIPILHWFLYLCTVECLPISFIAVMLMRQ